VGTNKLFILKNQTMEQQTAVEWLALRYHHRQGYLSLEDIAKAKEMEKDQIIKAAKTVLFNSTGQGDTAAEQYYNETFKK
jgi:hypothetical protein